MSEKEGGEASFSIDMFDPSKPNQSSVPGEQHDVGLPVYQLQEIGASKHDRSRRTYKGLFAQKNICKVVDPEAVGFEEPVSSYHD